MKISDIMNGKRHIVEVAPAPQRVGNARTVKKISVFEETAQTDYVIQGERIQTEYGFYSETFTSPEVCVYYSHMLPGSCTHKYEVKSGYRIYQCMAGVGVATLEKDDTIREVTISAGSTLTIEEGHVFSIAAGSAAALRFFVTESAGFVDGLTILEQSSRVEVPADLLVMVRPNAPLPMREFSKNDKAILNLMNDRAARSAKAHSVVDSTDALEAQRLMDEAQGLVTTDA